MPYCLPLQITESAQQHVTCLKSMFIIYRFYCSFNGNANYKVLHKVIEI